MRQRRLMNQINVVPYIDVMLVLLVIFMVTAPMIQSGNIDVPSAGPLASPPVEAAIIEIKKDGSLSLRLNAGAQPIPLTDITFAREIKAQLTTHPDKPMLIAADSSLPYQKVIDTLETVRQAGARKVSLQTQSGSSSR
ncbi:MAG: ExbD/TolR family protein [Azoarcus sp.]|jgi:biopolymer transport protein TolR|nr:ExbD/TolR family protein [Azoarcus sp.]